LVALVVFPAGLRASTRADHSKPYGRINILESSEAEVDTLGNNEHDGAKTVFAYVDANRPCELLIAVFNRNGRRLAHDWKPQWVSLEEWQEQKLTLGSYENRDRKSIEVWALFVAPYTSEAETASGIVKKSGR
jgi:hypothetical protein